MVCIEGNVYVMGGLGRDGGSGSYLKSAEMYRDDVPGRQWRAAVMSEVRRGLRHIGCARRCALRGTCMWWVADPILQPNLRAWSAKTRLPASLPVSGARCRA